MKATQTKTTRKETHYDFCTERKILAPSEIIFFSPARRQEKGMTLLSIYHELVMMKEPTLKRWILTNCKFRVKQPKNDYNLATVHPASKTKLDKYLATDPLGLADEAIRQEWTDSRQIVVQRGKLLGRERCAGRIVRAAVDAVLAVVAAVIRQQYLQKRDAPPVRRKAVAAAHARGVADHAVAVTAIDSAGGTGGVVLGGIRQNRELLR